MQTWNAFVCFIQEKSYHFSLLKQLGMCTNIVQIFVQKKQTLLRVCLVLS